VAGLDCNILDAGCKCDDAQAVQTAFQLAFERLKPIDAVIVGMYPRYRDQMTENAALARQFGTAKDT
jgi:hypothetical protein